MRIVVGRMGDRSGQASAPVRDRLRREVVGNLRTTRRVEVAEAAEDGAAYVVDGTIKRLALSQGATDVELAAQVDLVLSKPPRGILMVGALLLIDPGLVTDIIGLVLVGGTLALQKVRGPDPVTVSAA